MPQTHHANSKPSVMRQAVSGSMPLHAAVVIARAMPPSMHTAWLIQALRSGMSSFKFATLRPNSIQGQNSPVRPVFGEGGSSNMMEDWSGIQNQIQWLKSHCCWNKNVIKWHTVKKTRTTCKTRSASYTSHYDTSQLNYTNKKDS